MTRIPKAIRRVDKGIACRCPVTLSVTAKDLARVADGFRPAHSAFAIIFNR